MLGQKLHAKDCVNQLLFFSSVFPFRSSVQGSEDL